MANIMDKFTQFLEEKLMPVAGKVANQRHLSAIKDGMVITLPFIIVGSVFLILGNLPIPALANFYANNPTGQLISKWLSYPVDVTFNLLGFIACIGISYKLAQHYKLDEVSGVILSLLSFFLVTPFTFIIEKTGESVNGIIPLTRLGSQGLFVAIIMSIFTIEVFNFIVKKNIVIKMPDSVPPSVAKSFAALIPGFVVIFLSLAIRIGFEVSPFKNIHEVAKVLLTGPITAVGASFPGMVILSLMNNLLWSCGIHGSNLITGGIASPALLALADQNRAAFAAGKAIPNVVTTPFFDVFHNMGGSGATFALAIMLLFLSKSQQLKEIGKLAIAPAFFNINEPILFGLPIVMNPVLIIPFILAPLISSSVTYWAMYFGLVAKTAGIVIPWTTPPFIAGFLATGGHFSGLLMQVVNFLITAIIYYPFFKLWDKRKLDEENGLINAD